MAKGPAMSREEAVKAIEVGIGMVADLKEKGYNVLATGEMGIGNTTTSSAAVSYTHLDVYKRQEQMDELSRLGIDYDVIPGVSSFLVPAAALKNEYTLPGVSQTVILTRMEGRTPMPPKEQFRDLAKHNSTMIIFLSVGMIEQLADTLKEEYREDTPVAVVYKASWEDQKIVIGNLTNIAQKVKEAGITKTALTVVGDFLGDEYELSKLYDKTFTHEFRQAKE